MSEKPALHGSSREEIQTFVWAACRYLSLKPAPLAKLAGIDPSTLHKFLYQDGHNHRLGNTTLEKIIRLLDTLSVDRVDGAVDSPPLQGETRSQVLTATVRALPFSHHAKLTGVTILGRLEAGLFNERPWPKGQRYVAPMYLRGTFDRSQVQGYEVGDDSADDLYPAGSILAFLPLAHLGREPRPGERIIIHRDNGRAEIEHTVRELQESGGQRWLVFRTQRPELRNAVPWPTTGDASGIHIVGVVIGSFSPEPFFN